MAAVDMDRPVNALEGWHDEARARLDKFLAEKFRAQSVRDESALSAHSAVAAWDLELKIDDTSEAIRLTVDKEFPFSLPKLFMLDKSKHGQIAHVSGDGELCVVPSLASSMHRNPEAVAEFILNQANLCLRDSIKNNHVQDLIDEFDAYWRQLSDSQGKRCLSLVKASGPTRHVYWYEANNHIVLADSIEELENWMDNAQWKKPKYPREYQRSIFIWLKDPVPASELPSSNLGVRDFLAEVQPSAVELLQQVLPQLPGPLPVLFGMPTKNGVAMAALVLQEPRESGKPGSGNLRTFKRDGFRKTTKIPSAVLESRYLRNVAAKRLITKRSDLDWHSYRAGSQFSDKLGDKSVCLIGCGALGSHVAQYLARSGIGKLILVDGDTLEWNNIGRHVLGAEYIGQYKEQALRSYLGQQLPYLCFDVHAGATFQDLLRTSPDTMFKADLVLSTTGSWAADDALNLVMRSVNNAPHTVFAWSEAFGCAGQALLVTNLGGCLRCGMDEVGEFSERATVWSSDTLLPSGPCGELFQPFGIAELIPVQGAIVRLVLDALLNNKTESEICTWLGEEEYLKSCGGSWSAAVPQDLTAGGAFWNRPWPRSAECILCGGGTA